MATDACTISCKTASGKSLDELSRLIQLRSERLGEMTKDAVIATAIDVLVSLRTDTLEAISGKSVDPPRRIAPRRDLYISFKGGTHIPCLRIGSPRGPEFKDGGSFFFASKGNKIKDLTVFQIVPRHERIDPYFVAAHDAAEALKFEGGLIKKRIDTKGGLARTALGIAMAKISTRNPTVGNKRVARLVASKLAKIEITGYGFGEGEFGLDYKSDVEYSYAALKGGPGGVELAMQKAANKIAGMITHAANKAGDFEHDVETPFPEVRRPR